MKTFDYWDDLQAINKQIDTSMHENMQYSSNCINMAKFITLIASNGTQKIVINVEKMLEFIKDRITLLKLIFILAKQIQTPLRACNNQ